MHADDYKHGGFFIFHVLLVAIALVPTLQLDSRNLARRLIFLVERKHHLTSGMPPLPYGFDTPR
jgi:hypothetical protein